ncbi:MAG: insulinase family protein, partial [Deltaproteobacteria bacterium]|nr:insulinase family protein [Deltaproteobacteria bacterium]
WTDQTVYFFIAPTSSLSEVITMEAERFQNLFYEEPEFKTESGAVLGEYNKNFSDPLNQMEEDLMDLAFVKSTYKHTTMGFLPDIKAMPTMFDYSLMFFDRHYVPGKAVITIVGDFDEDAVMEAIRTQYAGWNKPGQDVSVPEEPEQKAEKRTHRDWKNPVLPQMLVGYKAPAYDNSNVDFAALTLIGEMIFGKTSPLYRKLVLDDQIAEDIEFWDWPHRDPCLWLFTVKFKKKDFDAVLADVDAALQDVIDGKTTGERLAAVKSHYRYSFVLAFETPRKVANQLSFYATLDGDPASAEKFLARMDEVTIDDLERVAARYLVASRRTVVTLSHPEEKGGE